jgi:branched-chain amino acid transport system ATP-binding protein
VSQAQALDAAGREPSASPDRDRVPLLAVERLDVYHGQLRALQEVSFSVAAGEVYAFIGANGAGKSTLLRTIAGLHRPAAGRILLDGVDLVGKRPEERLAAGVALVPEGRRLFRSLTLEENLQVGTSRARPGPWDIAAVFDLFPWMVERRRQLAYQLSGGEQQAVAIGRALVANPRLLLLDELSLGLSPLVVHQIYGMLPRVLEGGMTVLLVEQDVSQALRVATHVHCLLEGRSTLQGRPDAFTPAEIEDAYFGLAGGQAGPGSVDSAGSGDSDHAAEPIGGGPA